MATRYSLSPSRNEITRSEDLKVDSRPCSYKKNNNKKIKEFIFISKELFRNILCTLPYGIGRWHFISYKRVANYIGNLKVVLQNVNLKPPENKMSKEFSIKITIATKVVDILAVQITRIKRLGNVLVSCEAQWTRLSVRFVDCIWNHRKFTIKVERSR